MMMMFNIDCDVDNDHDDDVNNDHDYDVNNNHDDDAGVRICLHCDRRNENLNWLQELCQKYFHLRNSNKHQPHHTRRHWTIYMY